jgi:aldehyde dehydrogenase (NAD+)
MEDAIKKFYGNDAGTSSDYGKIIHAKHFKKLKQYISQGKIFYGGKYDESKLYIEPTILTDISLENDIMKEEIFGPILPVISFSNTQEAMDIVRKNKNPLSFYLFTKDKNKEQDWMRHIPFGGGCINNTVWYFTNKKMPFGGIGHSGLGAYHGKYTFDLFSHRKPVLKTATWFDPSMKYPPFKGKINLLKKVIG